MNQQFNKNFTDRRMDERTLVTQPGGAFFYENTEAAHKHPL